MTRKRLFAVILLCVSMICLSEATLIISLWQIEMIWVSRRRNEPYVIPFNSHKSTDYWFWHDIWFLTTATSFITTAIACIWLTWRLKELWNMMGDVDY